MFVCWLKNCASAWIEFGFTEIEAVGAGAAGGGGGGGGVAFFPHAPRVITAPRVRIRNNHFGFICFTFYSSRDPEDLSESDEVDLYLLRFTISNSNSVASCVQ